MTAPPVWSKTQSRNAALREPILVSHAPTDSELKLLSELLHPFLDVLDRGIGRRDEIGKCRWRRSRSLTHLHFYRRIKNLILVGALNNLFKPHALLFRAFARKKAAVDDKARALGNR